ncbi:MAG: hypothetical protein NC299_16705, partial [Lachnospiraceae bacterium]|nr:hypothetical protein [Lachnospiraceae bacterium]
IGFENTGKTTFKEEDIKASIVYYNDEGIMLNAAAYPESMLLKSGQRTYRSFNIDDVMFGDVFDIVSYKVNVSYYK